MATANFQVNASAGDADETSNGVMDLTGANISLTDSDQWGGVWFENVGTDVPQGATINTAILTINLPDANYDDIEMDVYAQDADSASIFTTDAYNISGRARTTAKTNVSEGSVGTGEYEITVTGPVQEVVNRPGFGAGSDLALILDPLAGIALRFKAYDGDSEIAAELDIDYSTTEQPMSLRLTTVPRLRQWQPGRL